MTSVTTAPTTPPSTPSSSPIEIPSCCWLAHTSRFWILPAMSRASFEVMNVDGGRHVKMWTRGVPVEDEARAQLANTAKMPFIFSHLAAMPDVHLGLGATVGSVVATKGAIIPAAVGGDIG